MIRPMEVYMNVKEWDDLWEEGRQQIKKFISSCPNEEFKIEHTLRMLNRIKGRAEGQYFGRIGHYEAEAPDGK